MKKPRPLAYFEIEDWDALWKRATASRRRLTPAEEVLRVARFKRTFYANRRKPIEPRKPKRAGLHGRQWYPERLAAAMEPGRWYGVRDLINGSGLSRDAVHAKLYQRLVPWGWVDKARNPNWRPVVGHCVARGEVVEPRYLWRLSAKGERAREKWLAGVREQQYAGRHVPDRGEPDMAGVRDRVDRDGRLDVVERE